MKTPLGLLNMAPSAKAGDASHPVGLIIIAHHPAGLASTGGVFGNGAPLPPAVPTVNALSPPDSFWPSPATRAAFERPFSVDHSHDIPYVAGYSKDGGTIYIDRNFPKQMTVGRRAFDPEPFVILHERVEKAVLDTRDQKYQTAHSDYATQAEHDALKQQLGFTPKDIASYDATMKAVAMKIARLPNKDVPRDLDLTPYRDTGKMAAVSPDKMR